MHSSGMSSRLNHWPSLVRTRKKNSITGQSTRKTLIKTFIETWLARAIEISLRREGSHVCQPSLLTILIIPYSLPKISTNKNSYPDTRNAELQTIPDAGALPMWCCAWSTVLLRLLTCASMSGNECSSDNCIVGYIVDLTLATDQIHPFTVFDQVFQKMTILLYLYKWKNIQRHWDRCAPALYAYEQWYDTPREVNRMFFRDSIRHDDRCSQDFCARRLRSVQGWIKDQGRQDTSFMKSYLAHVHKVLSDSK